MQNSITGLVIVCFVLFISEGILISLSYLNNNIKKTDLKRYYWGNKGYIKYVPKKDSYGLFGFGCGYFILLFVGFLFSNTIFKSGQSVIWEHKGAYINEIPNIMISSFLSVIAILGIATAINKKQYITFNVYDILMKYKIQEKVIEMVIIITFSYSFYYICAILQNISNVSMVYFSLKTLILYSFIMFLYLVLRCCLIIGNILFSNHGFELKVLDNLYTNFWYKDIKIDTEKWDLSGVKYNLEYLLNKYYLNKITKIKKVKFCTVLEEYNNLKFIYYLSFIFYYGMFFISLLLFLYYERIYVKVICIVLYWSISIAIHKHKSLKLILASTLFDRCGYLFEFEKIKYFCSDVSVFNCKCTKFIEYIKCILAFYRIAINKENNKDVELLILKNIANSGEIVKDDSYYILLYLILYIKYKNNTNINEWCNEYHDVIKDKICITFLQADSVIYQTMNAVISDIDRNIKDEDVKELRNQKFYAFINEICAVRKSLI